MTHHAKASSAGSTEAGSSSRGLIRRAFATRGAFGDTNGSGASSSRRARSLFAVIALVIAALAIAAAPASAASTAQMGTISAPSYTSARVTGEITTSASFKVYSFEYATSESGPWSAGFSEFLSSPVTSHTVQGTIKVPKGGTKYFVRLTVGGFGSPEATSPATAPYPSFTALTVDPPTLPGVVAASSVFSTSATATGKVKRPANTDPAFDISACRFEYVDDAEFTATGFATANPVPCEQATPFTTPNGETEVTAKLTGLSPGTTYHLQLAAENAAPGVATKEATAPFTTSAKVAEPIVIATNDAIELGFSGVHAFAAVKFSGEVQRPAGDDPALDVSCRFEYVTDQQFTEHGFESAGQAPCVGHSEVQSLTVAAIAGKFRLSYGGQTTSDLPFNATAGEVQDALRGMGVDLQVSGGPGDGAGSTPYRITFVGELGEKDVAQIVATSSTRIPLVGTANVTTLTTGANAFEALNDPPMNQPKGIGAEIYGLTPETIYHLRLAAENSGGTAVKDAADTFTTLPARLPVFTLAPATPGYTTAEVSGTVDPEGGDPTNANFMEWRFQYSTEPGNPPVGRIRVPREVSTAPKKPRYPSAERSQDSGLGPPTTSASLPPTTTISRCPHRDPTSNSPPRPLAEPTIPFDPVTAVTANSAHFSAIVDTHAPAGPLARSRRPPTKPNGNSSVPPNARPSPVLSGAVTGRRRQPDDLRRRHPPAAPHLLRSQADRPQRLLQREKRTDLRNSAGQALGRIAPPAAPTAKAAISSKE